MITIVFNGQPLETHETTTLAGLLKNLGLVPQRVAVEVNLELIPRNKHDECQLHAGDRVEVVTLVGGG
jgi:thiamine biosynthesis protein ThiS